MTPEAFAWQGCPECGQGNGHAEPGNKQIENEVLQTQPDIADGTKTVGTDQVSGVGHQSTVYVQVAQRQVGGGQIADQLAITCIARGIENRPPR